MIDIATLRDLNPRGKTVLLRLDLNSPIDPTTNQILDDKRFREHVPTIQYLDGNRVVVLTHQSRPGKKDFTTLQAHARYLEKALRHPVLYIDDIFGKCARDAVKGMKAGEVVMLENVRFNAEENLTMKPQDAAKTLLVRKLAGMADLFVNDAFGTSHRSQPTMVGLPVVMRSVAGLLMEREVANLGKVLSNAPRPVCFVLGGTKVDDSMEVARNALEKNIADQVMVTGVVANVFLLAKGYAIGTPSTQLIQQLEYMDQVGEAKKLLAQFKDRITVPEEVAVRERNDRAEYSVDRIPSDTPVLDIGTTAIAGMASYLRDAGTVVFNGPAGVFEEAPFATGTYELLRAAAKVPFSVIGGGHTAAVIERMGIGKEFTHISTGGGACIEFLTGKKLPALDALEQSKKLFGL